MLALCLATALTAAPARVAVMPFQRTQVSPELTGYAEDRVATELSQRGLSVTTPTELQAVLGLERQKQLLGCEDNSSCVAEISAALGVEFLLVGRLAKLGKRLEVDLRLVRQKDAAVVAREAGGVDDESELGALLSRSARGLATQLEGGQPTSFAWRLWVPVAAGAIVAAVGTTVWLLAERSFASYLTPGSGVMVLPPDQVAPTFSALSTQRGLGIAGLGVGLALIASGIIWNAVGAVVVATPDGAAVSLGGRW